MSSYRNNSLQNFGSLTRNSTNTNQISRNLIEDGNTKFSEDREAMALYSRVRSQEEEIQNLRDKIATACIKEMHSLNEKFVLERRCSELRMAIDEKQNEAVTSALNELARRKGDIEENLKLAHDLKIAEDEKHIFMTSMLGLLAEYGVWPRVVKASSICGSIKRLHDQLQWKFRASHDRIRELASLEHQAGMGFPDRESHDSIKLTSQLPYGSTDHPGFTFPSSNNGFRNTNQNNHQTNDPIFKDASSGSPEVQQNSDDATGEHDEAAYIPYEEGPGIEGFQIVGEALPGEKLVGCGFPVRGTTLCMFQWVRHLEDGTRQYIEGATNPEYIVTCDDVDKMIAVECIPMDEQGRQKFRFQYVSMPKPCIYGDSRLPPYVFGVNLLCSQGDIVRLFANDKNKIRCDPDMETEINLYISRGQATFSVLFLMDSSNNWSPATLTLRKSGYQLRVDNGEAVVIVEKFSRDMLIKIPPGISSQFVLISSDGSSHPLSTREVRMRDTLVLTMRTFQNKALAERRKGRA